MHGTCIEPDRIPDQPKLCDCYRLASVLPDTDHQLLAPEMKHNGRVKTARKVPVIDHICERTARDAVWHWLRESAYAYKRRDHMTDPGWGPVRYAGRVGLPDNPKYLSLGDGRWIELPDPKDCWPTRLFPTSHKIVMAIRQTVDSPPRSGSSPEMTEREVEAGEELLRVAGDWLRVAHRLPIQTAHLPQCLDVAWVRNFLKEQDFPSTTDAARYVWKRIIRESRQITVTSLMLTSDISSHFGLVAFPEVYSQICGGSSWGTAELWKKAGEVAHEHAEWWKVIHQDDGAKDRWAKRKRLPVPDASGKQFNRRPPGDLADQDRE